MAYTKDQARAQVEGLVTNFRANEASLADVPEAQIEDNYIRKLFRYLNWNTDNTGLSVAEWEFVLQRTDDKGKRPDYILQLDGQQLLVMDAKKVKYDMHDPRWVTQVYAYAYSTQSMPTHRKIDFALLTDFQEFILLDCTLYAADSKAVGNFRILDWTYADYALQFDTLWELFERENMRSAAATRNSKAPAGLWARYLSPKKVKANRIAPDKAFLAEMDDEKTGWRVRLAKDMKKHNPAAGGALITAAVQLLIDRLIFIKALSDREIEADYLSELAAQVEKAGLAAGDAGWFNACRDIFAKLNQFYNGSIFEPRPELESVTVSNKVVRDVLRDLQPENSPYNFAVLPVELLGTIYERFLGRVVHATDARVRIEEKPEVRKAGGVFYTPQYIVEYIVQHTLGELLAKCKTPADAAKLKILDPACGSGSFLLGAYAALIKWHTEWYSDKQRLTQQDREAAYYDSDGRVRLTAKLKRQILLNNLFGVDIDAQAVEVTRFSLSLKALEDTRRDELYEEVSLFKQSVLPDLRHNIKTGNSLIGPDYFTGQMMLDPDELLRVKPFDWANEFSVVMANDGFDAVIGNPPYLKIEHISESDRNYFFRVYKSCVKRYDAFGLFVEKSLSSLRTGARFGMIIPSTMLNNLSFSELRKLLIESCSIDTIVNLGGKVFEAVNNDTLILIFTKGRGDAVKTQIYDVPNYGGGLSSAQLLGSKLLSGASAVQGYAFELRVSEAIDAIFDKIRFGNQSLGDICSVFQGFVTGGNEAYIVDLETSRKQKLERAICKPAVFGDGVSRYGIPNVDSFVIYLTKDHRLKNFPNVEKRLEPFKSQLQRKREVQLGRQPWYSLHWPRVQTNFERSPKILVQAIRNLALKRRVVAALDTEGLFADHTLNVIYTTQDRYDLKYMLGILNSTLINFVFSKKYVDINIKGVYLTDIPIRRINFSAAADKGRHDTMVQLVESMLALRKHKSAAQTQPEQELLQRQIEITDRQIDALVYELYDLTPAEIAIVEGAG